MALGKATFLQVEGLSELLDGLEELTTATQANVVKRALKNAGEPIAQDAERMAPRLTGKLKASIDVSTRLSSRQKRGYHKESQYEIYAGAGALRQSTLQEFGTRYDKPQPYMRPAWDRGKKGALESIKTELADEIEKARQRAARKAARQLAKMNV
jgi:HK97 gp10 family phage protein